jgi:hypothetical protein
MANLPRISCFVIWIAVLAKKMAQYPAGKGKENIAKDYSSIGI